MLLFIVLRFPQFSLRQSCSSKWTVAKLKDKMLVYARAEFENYFQRPLKLYRTWLFNNEIMNDDITLSEYRLSGNQRFPSYIEVLYDDAPRSKPFELIPREEPLQPVEKEIFFEVTIIGAEKERRRFELSLPNTASVEAIQAAAADKYGLDLSYYPEWGMVGETSTMLEDGVPFHNYLDITGTPECPTFVQVIFVDPDNPDPILAQRDEYRGRKKWSFFNIGLGDHGGSFYFACRAWTTFDQMLQLFGELYGADMAMYGDPQSSSGNPFERTDRFIGSMGMSDNPLTPTTVTIPKKFKFSELPIHPKNKRLRDKPSWSFAVDMPEICRQPVATSCQPGFKVMHTKMIMRMKPGVKFHPLAQTELMYNGEVLEDSLYMDKLARAEGWDPEAWNVRPDQEGSMPHLQLRLVADAVLDGSSPEGRIGRERMVLHKNLCMPSCVPNNFRMQWPASYTFGPLSSGASIKSCMKEHLVSIQAPGAKYSRKWTYDLSYNGQPIYDTDRLSQFGIPFSTWSYATPALTLTCREMPPPTVFYQVLFTEFQGLPPKRAMRKQLRSDCSVGRLTMTNYCALPEEVLPDLEWQYEGEAIPKDITLRDFGKLSLDTRAPSTVVVVYTGAPQPGSDEANPEGEDPDPDDVEDEEEKEARLEAEAKAKEHAGRRRVVRRRPRPTGPMKIVNGVIMPVSAVPPGEEPDKATQQLPPGRRPLDSPPMAVAYFRFKVDNINCRCREYDILLNPRFSMKRLSKTVYRKMGIPADVANEIEWRWDHDDDDATEPIQLNLNRKPSYYDLSEDPEEPSVITLSMDEDAAPEAPVTKRPKTVFYEVNVTYPDFSGRSVRTQLNSRFPIKQHKLFAGARSGIQRSLLPTMTWTYLDDQVMDNEQFPNDLEGLSINPAEPTEITATMPPAE